MAQKQKVHSHGTDGNRYFWAVNVHGEEGGVYRSRHAKAKSVIAEFAKNGKKITGIRAYAG